jgi:hypothetical protein
LDAHPASEELFVDIPRRLTLHAGIDRYKLVEF